MRRVEELDRGCLRFVVGKRRAGLVPLATALSELGRGGLLWLLLLAGSHLRRGDHLRTGLLDVSSVSGCYVASLLLSRLIGRRRPCQNKIVEPLINCPGGPSFPSDQAAAAVASVAIALRRGSRLAPALAALAAGNCSARVYVGVHYPSDVAFGAGLGIVWVESLAWLLKTSSVGPFKQRQLRKA